MTEVPACVSARLWSREDKGSEEDGVQALALHLSPCAAGLPPAPPDDAQGKQSQGLLLTSASKAERIPDAITWTGHHAALFHSALP